MKKFLVVLILAALVLPAFADDASNLPAGVIRTRIVPTYASATQKFDADGEKIDLTFALASEGLKLFNLGAAVEYGINDWLTAALQWAPGYTLWSDMGMDHAMYGNATINGAYDLFLGAKFLVLGDKGIVQNETMRFAAAAGVKIPMPGADFDEELEKATDGDAFILSDADEHAFGMGGRFYFDYLLTKDIFINLYNETIYYLPREDVKSFGGSVVDEKKYGMDITFEVEFHYAMMVAQALKLNLGLPVTYFMATESESGAEDDTYKLSVNPTVGLFFLGKVPFEVSAAHSVPLMGKSTIATSALTIQIKNYLKF